MDDTVPRRSCRRQPRPRREGDLRPTDVVGAFFLGGIALLAAAALAGAVQALWPWTWGRWLALHLAFVGGVSPLVLGASQFFAGAFLATDPPPRRLVRAQLATWISGTILLAVAVPARAAAASWIAAGLLAASLLFWGAAIATLWRRSLHRTRWAVAWYGSGALYLGCGLLAGSLLSHGVPWVHGDLLAAHLALNLAGWFGGAIVGTLHTFHPSLSQTRLRYPQLQGLSFAAWTAGVGALAIGYAWALDAVAIAGWLALCLGAMALLVNVAACRRQAPGPLSLAARVVGVAQPFLLAALVFASLAAIAHGPEQALAGSTRVTVGTLVVAGWIGLTVLGSLLHLLAVVVRVRGGFEARMPTPRPRLDAPLSLLAALALTALAVGQATGADELREPGRLLLLVVYLALAARVARLAGRILARSRPRI